METYTKRLCKQCGIREVQGCRCVTGADYCKICKDAYPEPHETFEESVKRWAAKNAEAMYDNISEEVFKKYLGVAQSSQSTRSGPERP